jgi:hypothetical protein
LTCATPSLCVAFDQAGNVITSTNPTGGASAWSTAPGPDSGSTYSASCPSKSLCVAINGSGRIGTSTNPAAGATTWSSQLVDAPPCAFTTPCTAEQIYAHDSHRTTVLDSAPPGSGTSLANLQLQGDLLTWTHDGMPRQAQLG